jgi:hypothetical protein
MSVFNVSLKAHNSVWAMYRLRNVINASPDYQRQGNVWTMENRQLLVDTILNKFDLPKIYLHRYTRPQLVGDQMYEYSIIDGKQRLSAIWDFIDGKFALSKEFEYYADKGVQAAGMTYKEIAQQYPDLKSDFDSFNLVVVEIETDDIEMIEEMFSRLNEAETLNAPEKRNAYSGPIPKAVRDLSNTDFFVNKLPFPNNRYKHYDLATKFLYAEEAQKIVATKKKDLDLFVEKFKDVDRNAALPFAESARQILSLMNGVFIDKDYLLRSTGMLMLYYYLFRQAKIENWVGTITRISLEEFEKTRISNREAAKQDLASADYDLLEFDKYNQSPNDKYAVEFRLKILLEKVFRKNPMDAYSS